MYVKIYVHEITINEKETINLKDRNEKGIGGFVVRKRMGEIYL